MVFGTELFPGMRLSERSELGLTPRNSFQKMPETFENLHDPPSGGAKGRHAEYSLSLGSIMIQKMAGLCLATLRYAFLPEPCFKPPL